MADENASEQHYMTNNKMLLLATKTLQQVSLLDTNICFQVKSLMTTFIEDKTLAS